MSERKTVEERLWLRVNRDGPISPVDGTRCWLWTGAIVNKSGHGVLRVGGRKGHGVLVHRLAYELLVGPIPEGAQLDHRHTCPKSCVNPAHLRVLERGRAHELNGENRAGAQRNSKSGVRGVIWDDRKKRWIVTAKKHGKIHYGGHFLAHQFGEAAEAAKVLRNRVFTHNDSDREEQQ